jgi:hypothetical protein
MIPKPIALGPTFPPTVGLKGADALGILGEGFSEGFAHEVLAAIRAPVRPKAKAETEVPVELPWAVLLGTPADRAALPSPSAEAPAPRRAGLEPRELPRVAEARPAGPATHLLREVRRDWVALPMPETGPLPEVVWVQQEPVEEPVGVELVEVEPVEVQQLEEPLLEVPVQRPLPEGGTPVRTVPRFEAVELLEQAGPELEPLPPAFEREVVRIRVDSQLAVEVTTRGRHVDVLISGSPAAIEPLRDMAVELGSQLLQDGYSLDDFEAHDEEPGGQSSQEQEEQAPVRPVRARKVVRGGRYA